MAAWTVFSRQEFDEQRARHVLGFKAVAFVQLCEWYEAHRAGYSSSFGRFARQRLFELCRVDDCERSETGRFMVTGDGMRRLLGKLDGELAGGVFCLGHIEVH